MKRTSSGNRHAPRKLQLTLETVRTLVALDDHALRRVAGGGSQASDCLEQICPDYMP